jgi:hypothetical protein
MYLQEIKIKKGRNKKMGLFKSKQEKDIEKKMLIKKTVSQMNRHIQKLEEQKQVYIEAAKRATKQGLDAQVNLALSGLKMTLGQQKKAQEMLLNFEITSQMKDMSMMTTEFLGGMSVLSKEMVKLTNDKEFSKVQKDFEKAMAGAEQQTMQMEMFLDENQSTFASAGNNGNTVSDAELEKLIMNRAAEDEIESDVIDKELEAIRNKLNS